jgi:DNA-binding transcriptional MocR family regulator
MAHLLESGKLQKHISETLQPTYAKRYNIMMSAIKQHLIPLGVTLPQADRDVVGGYFIWLRLPPRIKASLLSRRAKDTVNLVVAEGALFEVPGDTAPNKCSFPYELRLCFAWEEEEALREGIERLAGVISAMQNEAEGINPTQTRGEKGLEGQQDQSAFW